MPAIQVTANTSGVALWNQHTHKRALLTGLKIDNQATVPIKLDLLDCFTTDASSLNSTGAAQGAENLGTAIVGSGRVRHQITVPVGEFVSLGKRDLEEVTFLGKAYARGDTTTASCVVVATYKLK